MTERQARKPLAENAEEADGTCLIYIDRHLVEGLRARHLAPSSTICAAGAASRPASLSGKITSRPTAARRRPRSNGSLSAAGCGV